MGAGARAAAVEPVNSDRGSGLLIGVLALLSFWVVEQLHLPASFGIKGLNAINLLMLLTLSVAVVVRGTSDSSGPAPLKWPILLFFVALIWGFSIGQLIDNSEAAADLTILKTGVFYISLYFLFYYAVRTVREIRFLVLVLMGVAVLAGLEAMIEAVDYGLSAYSESKRAAGPFGPNYRASNLAAVYFAIFIPLFVAVAFFLSDRPVVRVAAVLGAGLLIAALFFTYSRQAYAIVAIVALLLALRKNLFVALLLSLALWNYDLWVPGSAVERVQMTTEQSDESGRQALDESTASRFELWEGASRMLADRPLGIGLNRFKREVGNYTRYTNLDAHNFYVLITAEAGLIGGVAILILAIAMLRLATSQLMLARTAEAKTMAYGFLGATLALLMGNLYGSRFLTGEVIGNYWVLAALSARYFQLLRDNRLDDTAPAPVALDPARRLRSADGRRLAAAEAHAQPGTAPVPMSRDQFGRLSRAREIS